MDINAEYRPAEKGYWEGRKSNPDMGNQYWHQQIEFVNWDDFKNQPENAEKIDIALLGYVCDEGVRRNRGRIGAHEGPKAVRDRLAKLPIHFEAKRVIDAGNIICNDDDMEASQELFAKAISDLVKEKIFPIGIGGGHDMSYAHYMGIKNALDAKKKVGIINFDAHFDLRPVEGKSNSGTPFNQIISEYHEKGENVDYYAIGIQQQSNTKELFDIAQREHINYSINYDCESSAIEMESLKKKLAPIIANNDYLYITIDMDGFSSAYAPGVSAPSPLGFTPYFVFKLLSFLFATNKVIAFDIAELNPSLDRDMTTASLAAKLLDFVVLNYEAPL